MNIQPKVSIIVPIHNAGKHLFKCIETLIQQSLRDIEIILVLDCPTDGSDKICEEYAKNDERIVIVKNKVNLHIGLSRNEGLKVAKGEYIGFSDHDDYRELDMYETLYNSAIVNNEDIVYSAFGYKRKEGSDLRPYPIDEKNSFNILPILIGSDYETNDWSHFVRNGGIWNKIYKRSLLTEHHIIFNDNRIMTLEDLMFQIECFTFAKKVTLVNKVFYYHVEDINNTAYSYTYYSYPLIISYLDKLKQFLEDQKIFTKYAQRYHDTVVYFLIMSFLNEFKNKPFSKVDFLFPFKIKYKNKSIVNNAFRNIKFNDTYFSKNKTMKKYIYKFAYTCYKI